MSLEHNVQIELSMNALAALKLTGQERKDACVDVLAQAAEVFPGFREAMDRHAEEVALAVGRRVPPYETSDGALFREVFQVPGLSTVYGQAMKDYFKAAHRAAQRALEERPHGYWDCNEFGKRFWRDASDTCKGVL